MLQVKDIWRYNHAKRYTYINAIKQWINDQFHMNIQTKPLNEFYIHSLLSFQVIESFFKTEATLETDFLYSF